MPVLCVMNKQQGSGNSSLYIVTVSYSFTQFSTLVKIYTTTAREPSIYNDMVDQQVPLVLYFAPRVTINHFLS